jgi:5-methylcytosine-specific restriction endonuclease McrA
MPGSTQSIDDGALIEKTKELVSRENEATLELLVHLGEVDSRRAFLAEGYSSLFFFLTTAHSYSEPAASRRVAAARIVRDFPAAGALFKERKVSLTTLSMIKGHLNGEGSGKLLEVIAGRSKREVEVLLGELQPAATKPRDAVKPVVVRRGGEGKNESGGLFQIERCDDNCSRRRGCDAQHPRNSEPAVSGSPVPSGTATAEKLTQITFTAGDAFMKKLSQVQLLLSNKHPGGARLEQVFDATCEAYLEQHCPARREQRRAARNFSAQRASQDTGKVTQAVRDAVMVRDGFQCTFVGADGQRCRSRHDLEVDHIVPRARGGASDVSSLRVLCRSHNIHVAENVFGKKHMAQFRRQ